MKTALGAVYSMFPAPVMLLGANVNGKPNYCTICCVGPMEHMRYICVGSQPNQYTTEGIRQNSTFSVNIPSIADVGKTDCCGIVSGHDKDKSILFESFYGKLKTAPMITQFPVCMECKVARIIDDVFDDHDLIIGELIETYCEENCLTEGKVDMSKVKPLHYAHEIWNGRSYWTIGDSLAKAWDAGKGLADKDLADKDLADEDLAEKAADRS